MKKYDVYGVMGATVLIGTYEAESEEEEEAEVKAEEDLEGRWSVLLCNQCAHEVELGDVYKTEVVEIKEAE